MQQFTFLVIITALCGNLAMGQNKYEKKEIKGYTLASASYAEIEPLIKKMLSADGTVGFVKARNKVLVYDTASVHKKIAALFTAATRPAVNIRVDIQYLNVQSWEDRGISLSVKTGNSTFKIKNGKLQQPDSVRLRLQDQKTSVDTNNTVMLTTMSGYAAQIWSTTTAVDKSILDFYNFYPFVVSGTGNNRIIIQNELITEIPTRDLGISMWMRPIYSDSGIVTVEVFPVLEYEVKEKNLGRTQRYRIDKVSTIVSARNGQRIFIGGGNRSMVSFMRKLFGPELYSKKKSSAAESLSIYLTPHVQIMSSKNRGRPQSQRPLSNIDRHFGR